MPQAPIARSLGATLLLALFAALSPVRGSSQDVSAAEVQALLVRGQYEQAETLARTRVEALKAAGGGGSIASARASDLLINALLLNGKGTAAATRTLAEQTLAIKEAQLGPTDPDLVPSLLNLGDTLVEAAEYGSAIEVMQRAETLCENGARPASVDLAEALDHLAAAFNGAGRYDDALRVLGRSVRARESAPDPTGVGMVRTRESIARAYQRKGDYAQASASIRRAVEIQEKVDPEHPAFVQTLSLLAVQLWFEGHLADSRDVSARAVLLAETRLRPDHPATAKAVNYLASALLDLGELTEARSLFERALAIAERTFGPTHYETSAYLNDLAVANRLLGDLPTAHTLFDRSLKIAEARFGPWHDSVATAVHNQAFVSANLGDYRSAQPEQLRAIAIWEHVFGRNHPFVAVALTELAAVYREQGLAQQSLPLLVRALDIRERRLGPDHRDVAITLADLAETWTALGRTSLAQPLSARAVAIVEGRDKPAAPDLANVLALHAGLQATRGDLIAARDYYLRALTIKEKVFGRLHPDFADTQAKLALVLNNLGDRAGALAVATEAENTGREHLRLMLRYLPERQSLEYAARRPTGLDLVASLIDTVPDAAAAAMDEVIRSRALVLDEMATRGRDTATPDGDADPLRAQLTAAKRRLANLIVRGPSEQTAGDYAMLVEAARAESEVAERALADRSAPFRAERDRLQSGLEQVRAALPPQSALVSFVKYNRVPMTAAPHATAAARPTARAVPSYLAFVLRPGGEPIMVPIGATRTVDLLVSQWREDIIAEGTGTERPSGSTRSSRTSGRALRQRVWDPIAVHLGDANHVFIVPEGDLSLVPFAALPLGPVQYLLDAGPVIHYLSSERDLVARPGGASVGRGMLALGDPAFDDRTLFATRRPNAVLSHTTRGVEPAATTRLGCGDFRTAVFKHLDGTLQEVQDVASLWNSPGSTQEEGIQVLVGSDASERAFKQSAPGRRVLHLATHGFFLGGPCLASPAASVRSVGGLVAIAPRRPANPARGAAPENPLLLSGLALAGANRRAAAGPDDEDGILTAEEVASLNLEGVEWAVLSACDTGVGEVKAGEGVFGLRRAFQVAGARTVIMSLWSVDDQATRQWMRTLYEDRFQKRLTTADAVREASLAMLQQRRAKRQSTSPFYWAAFVAAGDWR